MLVSLEVNYSGVHKFVWFFQVCNQADEHSVIFPVLDGAACWMGKVATTAAYQMDFTHLWNNLSTYIVPRSNNSNRPRSVPRDMQASVYFLVPLDFPTSPHALLGRVCPHGDNGDPNDCRLPAVAFLKTWSTSRKNEFTTSALLGRSFTSFLRDPSLLCQAGLDVSPCACPAGYLVVMFVLWLQVLSP